MTQHASGTFEVKLNPEANDSLPAGTALGRLSIDKQFFGDLEATSKGAMLSARAHPLQTPPAMSPLSASPARWVAGVAHSFCSTTAA